MPGTGKTTLVKHIIEALKVPEDKIVYCAYTGKACKVLQQKGNTNVLTLHKLLYSFRPNPDGTYSIEIEPGDNISEIKEKAWNTCYQEVEKQIQQLAE